MIFVFGGGTPMTLTKKGMEFIIRQFSMVSVKRFMIRRSMGSPRWRAFLKRELKKTCPTHYVALKYSQLEQDRISIKLQTNLTPPLNFRATLLKLCQHDPYAFMNKPPFGDKGECFVYIYARCYMIFNGFL